MKYPKRSQYKHAKARYRVRNWAEYEAGRPFSTCHYHLLTLNGVARANAEQEVLGGSLASPISQPNENRFCTQCGAPAQVDDRHCGKCGSAL